MSLTSTISVNKQPNIQDAFLSAARRAAARVTVSSKPLGPDRAHSRPNVCS